MNEFMVGVQGEKIVVIRLRLTLSKEEALNLAAWLATMADPGGEDFKRALEEVQS